MKKVLLYSGGLDSWLISQLWKPDVRLYVNINGDYSREEMRRLPNDVQVLNFPLLGSYEMDNKFIPMRNLYFLMLASNYGDEICLGATAGDWGNKDKTPEFLNGAERMINYLLSDKKVKRKISVCRDFINIPKSALMEEYLLKGGNIETIKEETFSCYTPVNGEACLECYPCFRKFALLLSHGAKYNKAERRKMWNYVKKYIIPTKEQGGYQGTYYTDRGEESKSLILAVETLKREFENECY